MGFEVASGTQGPSVADKPLLFVWIFDAIGDFSKPRDLNENCMRNFLVRKVVAFVAGRRGACPLVVLAAGRGWRRVGAVPAGFLVVVRLSFPSPKRQRTTTSFCSPCCQIGCRKGGEGLVPLWRLVAVRSARFCLQTVPRPGDGQVDIPNGAGECGEGAVTRSIGNLWLSVIAYGRRIKKPSSVKS